MIISDEMLREISDELINIAGQKFSVYRHLYDVSLLVLSEFMSTEWVSMAVTGSTPHHYFSGPADQHSLRCIFLADMLVNTQSIEGFASKANLLRSEKSFMSAIAEFEAVQILMRHGFEVGFVSESERKTPDLVFQTSFGPLALEVKYRNLGSVCDENALSRYFGSADKKSKQDKATILLVRANGDESGDSVAGREHVSAIQRLLKRSERVDGVILQYEDWISAQGRTLMAGRSQFVLSDGADPRVVEMFQHQRRGQIESKWKVLTDRMLSPELSRTYHVNALTHNFEAFFSSGAPAPDSTSRLIRGHDQIPGLRFRHHLTTSIFFGCEDLVRAARGVDLTGPIDLLGGLICMIPPNGVRELVEFRVRNADWVSDYVDQAPILVFRYQNLFSYPVPSQQSVLRPALNALINHAFQQLCRLTPVEPPAGLQFEMHSLHVFVLKQPNNVEIVGIHFHDLSFRFPFKELVNQSVDQPKS